MRMYMTTQGKTAQELAVMIERAGNVEVTKISISDDIATVYFRKIPMGFGGETSPNPINEEIFDDGYWYAYDEDYGQYDDM